MPKLTIDGREIDVEAGTTVLQAARRLETEIPVFCYHERLDIAGNCRMCLVEQKGMPKPIASCAMPVMDGMEIFTNTEKVKKAREGVLEFILMHHPLDCPVCDQGGECDLQDISMAYGRGKSRYEEDKRAVPSKQMGPLIKTYMTRCIHCTRCIRFIDRIGGSPELGGVARGENSEITTYLDASIKNELSGNLVDVCPVGALTAAPNAHKGRPWELRRTNSIDVMDAVGSNISVHTYGMRVRRIQPRVHEGINEEWISDKSRYACDGLSLQRLDQPYIKEKGQLRPATFEEAFRKIVLKIKKTDPKKMAALAGPFADCESLMALKDLLVGLDVSNFSITDPLAQLPYQSRSQYLFNSSIEGIEQADAVLIVGANIRRDASLVMARLRKRYLRGGLQVAYVGGQLDPERDLTVAYENLGSDPKILIDIAKKNHAFADVLAKAKNPMVIVGSDAATRADAAALFQVCSDICETLGLNRIDDNPDAKNWTAFNVLHTNASTVGALDIGFKPTSQGLNAKDIQSACEKKEIDILYLLGVDEDISSSMTNAPFVIYQGHHGDKGAENADVILPAAAYTEKSATYVNLEGRVQKTQVALSPPGEAREDWRILRALSEDLANEGCGDVLPYDSLEALREKMAAENPIFLSEDVIIHSEWKPLKFSSKSMNSEPFHFSPFSFYMSNIIAKHSPTMAKCEQELVFQNDDHKDNSQNQDGQEVNHA